MNLEKMKWDCLAKQKRGIHFILASVIIWIGILIIHLTSLPILSKNFFTFCFSTPLMPLAYMISKIIKVDFTNKENPLSSLGILFSINQMLYLLIVMWIYPTVPDKMVMVLAMIFGAHLLPYGWLYKSKIYIIMSVIIPIVALFIGCNFPTYAVALVMIMLEIIFSFLLYIENKNVPKQVEIINSLQ